MSSKPPSYNFMDDEVNIDFMNPTTLHDRVLLVEGKKFYVNSMFLSQYSEFFNGLFNSNFKEKNNEEIELTDVKATDFDNFLRALNPIQFSITSENLAGLMQLSCRFLSPSVWRRRLDFVNDTSSFNELSPRDVLEWSNGSFSDEIKIIVENHLTESFNYYSYVTLERIELLLDVATEYGLHDLKNKLEFIIYDQNREVQLSLGDCLNLIHKYELKKAEMKMEEMLVRCLKSQAWNYWFVSTLKDIFQDKLAFFRKSLRQEMIKALYYTGNYGMLALFFGEGQDNEIKSNAEMMLTDIYAKSNVKQSTERFLDVAKCYGLWFLEALIVDFIYDMANKARTLEDCKSILQIEGQNVFIENAKKKVEEYLIDLCEKKMNFKDISSIVKEFHLKKLGEHVQSQVCSLDLEDPQHFHDALEALESCKLASFSKLEDNVTKFVVSELNQFEVNKTFLLLENIKLQQADQYKDSLVSYLCKLFTNYVRKSEVSIDLFLQLAAHYNLYMLKKRVSAFLEKDFESKNSLKFLNLAVKHDLQQFKNLIAAYLINIDKSQLSEEDQQIVLNATHETKDFVQNILFKN